MTIFVLVEWYPASVGGGYKGVSYASEFETAEMAWRRLMFEMAAKKVKGLNPNGYAILGFESGTLPHETNGAPTSYSPFVVSPTDHYVFYSVPPIGHFNPNSVKWEKSKLITGFSYPWGEYY